MELSKSEDYRAAIRRVLLAKKGSFGKPYNFQQMAIACGVSKTYLSKVLQSEAHFNDDQLYLATEFLKLNSFSKEFLTKLHAHQRSQSDFRKKSLLDDLVDLEARASNTESQVGLPEVDGSESIENYFLNPHCNLIHLFLMIPRFQNNLSLIEALLRIPRDKLNESIEILIGLGLVDQRDGKLTANENTLHLPRDSRVFSSYRDHQRLRILERIRSEKSKPYSFSVSFAADAKSKIAIQELFFEFLEKSKEIVSAASAEEVYQLNFDLVEWT